MSMELKDLPKDQVRRIFRDFLKGVPKEKILKKNNISEGTLNEIIGIYGKRKHPNDVGGAEEIDGPLDLLVTPLDTGSTATENPVVARSPRDLRVAVERPLQEYDWDGPEEDARKKGGELTDHIARRNADAAKAEQKLTKEAVKTNKEATDATLKELTNESVAQKEALASQAVETAKATKAPEVLRREIREAAEQQQIAENLSEVDRAESVRKHAEAVSDRDAELIEKGKEETARLNEETAKARQEQTDKRLEELRAKQKSAEREGQAGERTSSGPDKGVGNSAGRPAVGTSGSSSSGSNPAAQEGQSGNSPAANGGQSASGQGATNDSDASTAGDPKTTVEPAKVDTQGLTKTEKK